MRKRFWAMLLSLAMILSLLPTWAIAEGGLATVEEINDVSGINVYVNETETAPLVAGYKFTATTDETQIDAHANEVCDFVVTFDQVVAAGDVILAGEAIVSQVPTQRVWTALPVSTDVSEGTSVSLMQGIDDNLTFAEVCDMHDFRCGVVKLPAGVTMTVKLVCDEATLAEKSYTAPADSAVAKIVDTEYATLAEAVAEAEDGDTITLLDNVDLGSEKLTVPANKAITIDGGSHKISFAANSAFNTMTGTTSLTVKNTTFQGSGSARYVVITPNSNFSGSVSLDNCVFKDLAKCAVIMDPNGETEAKLSITNCTYSNTPLGYSINMVGNDTQKLNIAVTYTGNTGVSTEFEVWKQAVVIDSNGKFVHQYNLAEAIAAAQDGQTVKLLANCEGPGIAIPANTFTNGLTIDFGGNTYTCTGPAVGSTGTENQVFQLLKGNKITMKDGTVEAKAEKSDLFRFVIQNYADLTLDGVTLDGTNLALPGKKPYTTSNNNGTILYKGDTEIIAPNGGVAFDVYDYASNHYDGVDVTIEDGVTVKGSFEVGGDREGGNKATLTIKGGTFSSDPSAFVPEGYDVTENGDVWTVEAKAPAATNVAQIGTTKYATLAEAIAAVPATGEETTITMIDDVNYGDVCDSSATKAVYVNEVASGKDIVLDLAGHTIRADRTGGKSTAIFHVSNGGALTINDTSNNKSGRIELYAGVETDPWAVSSSPIISNGNVTVNGGTIVSGEESGSYAVDMNQNGFKDSAPTFTMNGGKLDSTYVGLRLFANGGNEIAATINNGEISGQKKGLWVHQGSATGSTKKATVTINNGTITSTLGNAVEDWWQATDDAQINIYIINGKFAASTTETGKKCIAMDDTEENIVVTGGFFNQNLKLDTKEATYLADGYECVESSDDTAYPYKVVAAAVPQIEVEQPTNFEVEAGAEQTTGEILKEITNNTAVNSFANTGLDQIATKDKVNNTATTALNEVAQEKGLDGAKQTEVANKVGSGDFSTYVKVTPKAAAKAEEVNTGIKLTFDVKPMLKVTVDNTTVEAELEPKMIGESAATTFATPVRFRLPLTDDFDGTVKVIHYQNSEEDNNAEVSYANVQGTAGGKYVELLFNHFCGVSVQPVDEPEIVIRVGTASYDDENIQNAIEAACASGEKLEVLSDSLSKLTVKGVPAGKILYVISNGASIERHYSCDGNVVVEDRTLPGDHNVVVSAVSGEQEYIVNESVTVDLVGMDKDSKMSSYLGAYAVVTFDEGYLALPEPLPAGWTKLSDGTVAFSRIESTPVSMVEGDVATGKIATLTFTALKSTKSGESDTPTAITVTKVSVAVDEASTMTGVLFPCVAGAAQNVSITLGTREWEVGFDPNAEDAYNDTDKTYTGSPIAYGEVTYKTKDDEPAQVEYASAADGTYSSTAPTDAGQYYVRFFVPEDAAYERLESKPLPYTIKKAVLEIDTSCAVGTPVYTGLQVSLLGGDIKAYYAGKAHTTDNEVSLSSILYSLTGAENDYHERAAIKSNASIGTECTVYYKAETASSYSNYEVTPGSFTVKILSPVYEVVTLTDYVGGAGKLILVFTDSLARYYCDGNKMYNVTNLGYGTGEEATAYGRTDGRLGTVKTNWKYVYASLIAGTDPGVITVVSKNKSHAGTIELGNGKFDINDDGAINVGDAVSALLSGNKGMSYSEQELIDYMATILRADVDNNGKVEVISGGDQITAGDAITILDYVKTH